MKHLVTGKEMKFLDQNTSEIFHVPEIVLMEQASMCFVQELFSLNLKFNKALIISGVGNNGADGIAIGRLLNQKGVKASVFLMKDILGVSAKTTESYDKQLSIYKSYGMDFEKDVDAFGEYDLIIDAIFGIGLSRNVSGKYQEIIEKINDTSATKIAVDIASGLSSDDGSVLACAVKCDYTITFGFLKLGQFLWPGTEYSGRVILGEMGITKESFLDKKPKYCFYQEEDLSLIPKRLDHSNKGTYGKLLIIAGCSDMAGAAIFAAKSAYRAGTGLVKIFTSEENRTAIFSQIPEAILKTYGKNFDKKELVEALKWADAVVLGPGIGTSENARKIVDIVLTNATVPMVIDADALNIIAENTERLLAPHMDLIVTPHIGEMNRLTGDAISFIQSNIVESAKEFAQKYNLICVLKDFHTITAVPYGMTYVNLSGNNGMATAGSGDVLAGIIGGMLAKGMSAEDAASIGVYVHGKAGDYAALEKSKTSLIASDIIEGLNKVL